MSLIYFKATHEPRFAHCAQPMSISKVLRKLADRGTLYATTYAYEGIAYVVIRDDTGETTYAKLKNEEWVVVVHIMSINPKDCECWACKWRLLRSKYLDPTVEFSHIFNLDIKKLDNIREFNTYGMGMGGEDNWE